ncbi:MULTISPECIES: class I fructose-bisphosphate aldolase [unclassified Cyanobium]|uniref:class I fructose-bisphosphate aldolase n=1 Tax=unclassified Cyanobium TaxID=2627006 RepID=UPI0020CF8242|nr:MULTISPECIES: class I fructose-bisphosphate aldolase [unclassified Cyanobium]MCP9833247.1 fructose-bisphosphate aldolase class I [Cyanobium sp. La Preciosa 7G6]MCP9935890.1 fructose-bisphosphate aldolase class I [Cyanobium sp. Aljojuca 7A6]
MTLDSHREELEATAMALARPGTGLLAADESTGTIGKRFEAIGLDNTEDNRRAYRTLLATAPGLGETISGVILYEETLFQEAAAVPGQPGGSILELFAAQGLVAGIKLDLGVEPLAGGLPGETWCTGLKGLRERAAHAYARGARFAKWRAVLRISADGCPSELCVRENAWGLARYARTAQEEGLVPIVEPEILMDGDHDILTTAAVQEWVLRSVYEALGQNGVFLEGTLLKPSMTLPGADGPERPSPEQVAAFSVRTLRRSVPPAVPAILFLSGGLGEEEASVFLSAIHHAAPDAPWHLGFSYGRALQHSCLSHWKGTDMAAGQAALLARARANGAAARGTYVPGSEPSDDAASLFVANYSY